MNGNSLISASDGLRSLAFLAADPEIAERLAQARSSALAAKRLVVKSGNRMIVLIREKIEWAMTRYPDRHSAAIPALHAAKEHYGWCTPEAIDQVAAGSTPVRQRLDSGSWPGSQWHPRYAPAAPCSCRPATPCAGPASGTCPAADSRSDSHSA